MKRNSAFFQRSVIIAKKFLQTAVVIDDRAFFDPLGQPEPQIIGLSPPPTPATAPIGDSSPTISEPVAPVLERTEELPMDPDPHGINAKLIIESFAHEGIVCSVLRRTSGEDLTSPTDPAHLLSLVADILIVDWQVHDPRGSDSTEETLKFIKAAVGESLRDTPQKLRLIVIYTGASDLFEVARQVGLCLEAAASKPPRKDGDFAFQTDAMRVVVLGKPSNKRVRDQQAHQVNDDSELCARTIEEFSEMTAGLVSNVALDSLAQVRHATHGLLTRFGPQLDAAFLTHRALLDPPSEGNQHLIPLIVSELESILEDKVSISSNHLSDESITEWLDTRPTYFPGLANIPRVDTDNKKRQVVRDICLKGVDKHITYTIPSEPNWIKKDISRKDIEKLTNMIAAEAMPDANEKLELLMSFRSRYSNSLPMLSLGTILKSEQAQPDGLPNYWICLQPICDCYLRSEEPCRAFPLLKVSAETKKPNLIVEIDGTFVRLRWDPKVFQLQMFTFQSNSPLKTVVASKEDNKFIFSSISPTSKFRWIAELKFPQAQRVVQALASETARVGLTESEWLRRNAK